MEAQNPVYDRHAEGLIGQTFESFLVSLKIQGNDAVRVPVTKFGDSWNVYENGLDPPVLYIENDIFNVTSGTSNGIEVTVDLEIFDNADPHEEGDGVGVIIENSENIPNFELNGFEVKPGEKALVKIFPSLYNITEAASNRFDYNERKCVVGDEIRLDDPGYLGYTAERYPKGVPYTLTNCLNIAAHTHLVDNCKGFLKVYRETVHS